MEYKPLTPTEMRTINYYVIHRDRLVAYKLGNPASANWLRDTIARKAEEFFESDRIKYYRGFQDGGIVVVDEDELKSEDQLIYESERVPAVNGHNGGGFPSRYRDSFPGMMIEFFNIGSSTIIEKTDEKSGKVTRETLINALPTKAGFAAKLRVSMYTLNKWATEKLADGSYRYPEFAEAYKIVDAMIENILVTNTLMGHYQPAFAQFYAKNKLGYKERSDLVVEGGDKPMITINANMTPEEAAMIYLEGLNNTAKE